MLIRFRAVAALFPAIAVLMFATAASAADPTDFIYRYKMAVADGTSLPGDGGTPGDGTGGDGGGGETPEEPPGDGDGGSEEPVDCVDDPECSTEYEGGDRYPNPVIAPVRTILHGSWVDDDGWFYNNWQANVYSDRDGWVETVLTVKEDTLPEGLAPSGWDVGEEDEELWGGVEGVAAEVGSGRVVYEISVENEDGVLEKVSELVVRVEVVGLPANIVAPHQSLLVGDDALSTWFSETYGDAVGPFGAYALEVEHGTAPTGTVADVDYGSYYGRVEEAGSFSTVFAIRPVSDDGALGPKVSQLTISLDASPNLHQAALVALPEDAESELFPVTDEEYVFWNPLADLEEDLRRQRDWGSEIVAGATILGMEADSCPGGVTWALDSTDGLPPDMRLREVHDGLALLEYKLENTPGGLGHDPDDLPWVYEYVRAVAACKDGNGDTMVTYRSRRFVVHVMGGEAS